MAVALHSMRVALLSPVRQYAVGDVRSGSVKHVRGAIGEGAAVVELVHHHLSRLRYCA